MNNSLSLEEDRLFAKPFHESISLVRMSSFGKRLIITQYEKCLRPFKE
jgi:hypothetical protein